MDQNSKKLSSACGDVIVYRAKTEHQWVILQAVLKYGLQGFIGQIGAVDLTKEALNKAIMSAVTHMVIKMPYQEQTELVDLALSNAVFDTPEKLSVARSHFSGKMPNFLVLSIQAVEFQLGDFSEFLNLIPKSTATVQE